MKKSLAFIWLFLSFFTFSYTQEISFSDGFLTPKLLMDCKPEIERKINKFCDAIEYIGSYNPKIHSKQDTIQDKNNKQHRIDEIKSLFFRFDERMMTTTSKAYPGGYKRELRIYLRKLLNQSYRKNQPIYKIDSVDINYNYKDPFNTKNWKLYATYEDGTRVYEGSFTFRQEYIVKTRTIQMGNLETHKPPKTHETLDVDTKFIKVYLVLAPDTEENRDIVLIRLGDVYASILEKK